MIAEEKGRESTFFDQGCHCWPGRESGKSRSSYREISRGKISMSYGIERRWPKKRTEKEKRKVQRRRECSVGREPKKIKTFVFPVFNVDRKTGPTSITRPSNPCGCRESTYYFNNSSVLPTVISDFFGKNPHRNFIETSWMIQRDIQHASMCSWLHVSNMRKEQYMKEHGHGVFPGSSLHKDNFGDILLRQHASKEDLNWRILPTSDGWTSKIVTFFSIKSKNISGAVFQCQKPPVLVPSTTHNQRQNLPETSDKKNQKK